MCLPKCVLLKPAQDCCYVAASWAGGVLSVVVNKPHGFFRPMGARPICLLNGCVHPELGVKTGGTTEIARVSTCRVHFGHPHRGSGGKQPLVQYLGGTAVEHQCLVPSCGVVGLQTQEGGTVGTRAFGCKYAKPSPPGPRAKQNPIAVVWGLWHVNWHVGESG